MSRVFLSLGSNKGDRLSALGSALGKLEALVGRMISVSSVYETEPWGFISDQQFLNMAVEIESILSPEQLLEVLLSIEKEMGRVRLQGGYASRLIDLDILLYDDQVIEREFIQLPHPRLHVRKFVLIPLAEIAPGHFHPVLRKTISELMQECDDQTKVTCFINRSHPEFKFKY